MLIQPVLVRRALKRQRLPFMVCQEYEQRIINQNNQYFHQLLKINGKIKKQQQQISVLNKYSKQEIVSEISQQIDYVRFCVIQILIDLIAIIQSHNQMQPEPLPKNEQSNSKQGLVDFQKKKEMISNLLQARKENNRRKAKLYEQLLKQHKFWDNQPTLRYDKQQVVFGNIEGQRTVQEVRVEPLDLPDKELFWCQIDLNDEKQLDELYTLLTYNYVEDDDNTFRFDYSREFLKWALTPPGYQKQWIIGIRNQTKQLVASITGVPVLTVVEQEKLKMAEINFLCVHKDYRVKRLTPLLVAQVTRRVNLKNKWQAIYTSGRVLPTPFTQATYWHRSLNPLKLIDIRFSALGPHQTKAMVKKLYQLPEEPTIEGLRVMTKKDVDGVSKLINSGLNKYVVKFHFTQQEVRHYFLPRDRIIYTYVRDKQQVVDGKKKNIITDVLSFYSLPSHVMKHPKHNMLYACYSFYNFATTVSFQELIRNALIMAKKNQFDVYNCLDLMENAAFFEDLFFQVGDGCLNYYFYNWIMKRRHIKPQELAVVLF